MLALFACYHVADKYTWSEDYCMSENGCCVNPMSLFLNIMQFNIDNSAIKWLIYVLWFICASQQGAIKPTFK